MAINGGDGLPATNVLTLVGATKSFGSTMALVSVDFDLRPGEVHVVAGENGAGKSTLMKILSGVYADYGGTLKLGDKVVRFRRPQAATAAGIATIHQELSLVGSMSVRDNLELVRPGALLSRVSRAAARDHARRTLDAMQVDVNPDHRVDALPVGLRQLIEIARALARDARVFIMDEPTSALREVDAERLFSRIDALRAAGKSIVYISHRMTEIYRLADRISVLRDGRRVVTASPAELDQHELVKAMLGRTIPIEQARAPRSAAAGAALEAHDLVVVARDGSSRLLLDHVSLRLRRGEILGLAGLRGSGASELLHGLFGSVGRLDGGSVRVGGAVFQPHSPRRSIARGVVLLSNDRTTSVLPSMSVLENATLSAERDIQAVVETVERLRVVLPSLAAPAGQLSGGNQQKVALARCLLARPKVLMLDEPTRGIDIGAKADVHGMLVELAAQGVSILLVASDTEELLALADRVLVFFRGRIVDELDAQELSRDRIVRGAMGSPERGQA